MKIDAAFFGRLVLIVFASITTISLIRSPIESSWMHPVHLVIHEAGHMIFAAFGEFMGILGGSLLQILVPIMFTVYFILREDYFAMFFCMFWLGDSIVNVGTYLADGKNMYLPLIADGLIHDWNWLLSRMDLLESAEAIGQAFHLVGYSLLVISIIGMVVMTVKAVLPDRVKTLK